MVWSVGAIDGTVGEGGEAQELGERRAFGAVGELRASRGHGSEAEHEAVAGSGEGNVEFAVVLFVLLDQGLGLVGGEVDGADIEEPTGGTAPQRDGALAMEEGTNFPEERAKHDGVFEALGGVDGKELDGWGIGFEAHLSFLGGACLGGGGSVRGAGA